MAEQEKKVPQEQEKKDKLDSNLKSYLMIALLVFVVFCCCILVFFLIYRYNGFASGWRKLMKVLQPFIIGLVSCSFAAGGSALTALTTSFTVDILGTAGKSEARVRKMREWTHVSMALGMGVTILIFNALNSTSAIDAVYRLASYTYGPILGMFAFGILTERRTLDKAVPAVSIAAPLICLVLQLNSERWFGGYQFSYELLIINGLLTFLGLLAMSRKKKAS